jgi:electron transfer flavoprotein beta subunit
VEAPLPAVISVSDAINEPRYASLKAIMGARKKPQSQVALSDLGVEGGSSTEVLELTPPAAKQGGRRIEDDNGSSAEEIVAFLLERKAI